MKRGTSSPMTVQFANESSFWFPKYTATSAWIEHAPFAFWLIDVLRPRTLVELGTHYGFSYFAFCQAVEKFGISAQCYAVDTWRGDEHAGFYGEDVFRTVDAYNNANYSAFSRLIRSDFLEASKHFPDNTIDLLHIDGRHYYEDVKEDFLAWKPKLSDRAVVLFHDINVRERDFGVYRLWGELQAEYPNFFFNHGHGLGIIGPKDIKTGVLAKLLQSNSADAEATRSIYARLGRGVAEAIRVHELEAETSKLLVERNELLVERNASVVHINNLHASESNLRNIEKSLRAEIVTNRRVQAEQMEQIQLHVAQSKRQKARIAILTKKEKRARQALNQLRQSISWRATSPLRAGLELLPYPLRLTLRRGIKGIWWALTPHKLPERLTLLRTRKQVSLVAKQPTKPLPAPSKRSQQVHLSFRPDPSRGHADRPADQNGHYVMQERPDDYTYVPPRRPENLDTVLTGLSCRPLFSIVVPTYNTTADLLSRMVASVEAQWYPNWELILADDASPLPETREFLESIKNPQVEVLLLDKNSGISGATNAALQRAKGDYVVFLDHDDELTQDCLYELALCINREEPDYIYSDEDKIDEEGRFTQPFFKPSWSPDAIMSTMYTCHVSCVRRSLLQEVGMLRSEFDGSQDWDLVLRVTERAKRIAHIPKVLYHWRIIPGSASGSLSAKSYAIKTGRSAREAALKRRGLVGSLEPVEQVPGHYRVRYAVTGNPLISVIIPSRNNGVVLRRCLDSLFLMSSWRNFEVVVLDNGSDNPETLNILRELANQDSVQVIRHDAPFNYSELNNIGVREAKGEILLFLNDDTELLTHDGLERMAGYAQLAHVGAVGAKLLYPEVMQVQHAGVLNLLPGPSHAFLRKPPDAPGYFMRNLLEYNWMAVTGACLMVERSKFDAVGGFDETFPVAYNDVELCFRLLKNGLYHVVCPSVRLLHHESLSRGYDLDNPEKRARLDRDRYRLYAAHPDYLMHDPFYNPNLHPGSINFDLPA